ncbi:MAG: EAL domain-containing protein [Candidatus Thiodiazotropha sp.]
MKPLRLSLISRITLLVLGIEIVAFALIGWFYFDHFRSYSEEHLHERFILVGKMLGNDDLPVSAISRLSLISNILEEPVEQGVLIGGSGHVISSSDAALLGYPAAELEDVNKDLAQCKQKMLCLISEEDRLTGIIRVLNPHTASLTYTVLLRINMSGIRATQKRLIQWGILGSLAFIILSSTGVTFIARHFYRTEREATRIKDQLEQVMWCSGDGWWDWDVTTGEAYFDHRWYAMLGYDSDEISPDYQGWKSLIHPEDLSRVLNVLDKHIKGERDDYSAELRMKCKDGSWKWILTRGKAVERNEQGYPIRMAGTHSDISKRMAIDARLRESEQRYRMLAENSPLPIQVFAPDGHTLRVNEAWKSMWGLNLDGLGDYNILQDKQLRDLGILQLIEQAFAGETVSIHPHPYVITGFDSSHKNTEMLWLRAFSYPVYDEEGNLQEVVLIQEDVTASIEAQQKINGLAYLDPLTQLPNRRLLLERLERALAASNRSHNHGGLLMLDLDDFKSLNDTYGHDAGDQLLVEVSDRLRSLVRENDTTARLGGDEFIILVEDLSETEHMAATQIQKIAEKIRFALATTYRFDDGKIEHHSTPSIGITLFKGQELPIDTLFKHVDVALYQAKDAGRNCIRFYNLDMQNLIDRKHSMTASLRKGFQNGELKLHYQPQTDWQGRVVGYEALLRWFSPDLGSVSPGQFIPLAEESGLIIDIGQWVMDEVYEQLMLWHNNPRFANAGIAVNVSARQFHQSDFIDRVQGTLARCHSCVSMLKLELTESVVLDNIDSVREKMLQLRELGVQLALDDFGTGYSSLSYLKQLPIQELKIDRSFIRDLETDPSDRAIVQAILAMSDSFDINVIAEGVETLEQKKLLETFGCRYFQGYLFGKPMPLETPSD